LNDAFDPTATSLSKRADAAGRHGLIKPVQERRSDESSIPACGVISAYGLGLAVKQPSWTISLFDAGRRVRVGSPRNENIRDTFQHRLAPLIAQEGSKAKNSPIGFGL